MEARILTDPPLSVIVPVPKTPLVTLPEEPTLTVFTIRTAEDVPFTVVPLSVVPPE